MRDEQERVRTTHHELVLLAGMTRALDGMLSAIEGAKKRVWIETYILRHDKLGERLIAALAPLAAAGVDVRILYDDLGSKNTPPGFMEQLRHDGIQAQPFRRRRTLPTAIFPRNHARIVLVDDTAFTGGSAWGDEWLPEDQGGRGWYDVCLGVRGPCIEDFARIFLTNWRNRDVDAETCDETARYDHPDLTIVSDHARGPSSVLDEHVARIRRAKRRVWIHNAYFFAPLPLAQALAEAAMRGVDVKVIVPRQTDLPAVRWAARGEYRRWLRSGIEIYEYDDTVTHAKVAVIDDDWCTVGSFNMNPTSVACANELNVFVRSPEFVARVARQLRKDLDVSVPISGETVAGWRWLERLGYHFAARVFRAVERVLAAHVPKFLWADRRDAKAALPEGGRRRGEAASPPPAALPRAGSAVR